MRLFNWGKKNEQKEDDKETDVKIIHKANTLRELAIDEHTYWKFSQSQKVEVLNLYMLNIYNKR